MPSWCGMQQRLPSLVNPPIAFAHRGAKAHAPENTLEAFALALRLGATGLESDVWLTADGIAVLDHDGVVKQGRRKRPISELRRDEVPPVIPSLSELLAMHTETGFALSLDLKGHGTGAEVISTVRRVAPSLLPDLWLCHPDRDALVALRPMDASVRLVNSTSLADLKEGPERRAASLRESEIDAINLHHTEWTGGLMALFHRFDRYCLAWDLQHDFALDKLLRMGADGIFSDWVDRMMEAMGRNAPTARP
jgi:glycerophosphoryl diester phosphodiesterase